MVSWVSRCAAQGLGTSHPHVLAQAAGATGALKELGRRCGREPVDRRDEEAAKLKRKLEASEAKLVKARRAIETEGNVSALLEEMLGSESGAEEHAASHRRHGRGADAVERDQAGVPGAGRGRLR